MLATSSWCQASSSGGGLAKRARRLELPEQPAAARALGQLPNRADPPAARGAGEAPDRLRRLPTRRRRSPAPAGDREPAGAWSCPAPRPLAGSRVPLVPGLRDADVALARDLRARRPARPCSRQRRPKATRAAEARSWRVLSGRWAGLRRALQAATLERPDTDGCALDQRAAQVADSDGIRTRWLRDTLREKAMRTKRTPTAFFAVTVAEAVDRGLDVSERRSCRRRQRDHLRRPRHLDGERAAEPSVPSTSLPLTVRSRDCRRRARRR